MFRKGDKVEIFKKSGDEGWQSYMSKRAQKLTAPVFSKPHGYKPVNNK